MHKKNVTLHHITPAAAPLQENLHHTLAANLPFRYSWLKYFFNPSLIWYSEGARILLAAWIHNRLIHDIQATPQSNAFYRVYWNGRDHDGDDTANEIYFYKPTISVNI